MPCLICPAPRPSHDLSFSALPSTPLLLYAVSIAHILSLSFYKIVSFSYSPLEIKTLVLDRERVAAQAPPTRMLLTGMCTERARQ